MMRARLERPHVRRAFVFGAVALLTAGAAGAAAAAAAGGPRAGRAGFAIAGRPAGRLAPGSGAPIDLRLTNRRHFAVRVTRLVVSVRAIAGHRGCGLGANFRIVPFRGRYPITLPAGRSRTLAQLGYPAGRWPRVEMRETGRNQDACAGARLALAYSGRARRAR
jgi:hypothetical protein